MDIFCYFTQWLPRYLNQKENTYYIPLGDFKFTIKFTMQHNLFPIIQYT